MNEQETRLREAILAEARKAADDILAAARKEADALKASSAEARRKSREAALANAAEVAEKKCAKIAAKATMDISRQWLERQEACIDAVLQEALAEVEAMEGENRETALEILTGEALLAVGDESCRVIVGKKDAALVTPEWIKEVRKTTFDSSDTTTYTIEVDETLGGGVVFITEDGHLTFDNTFARRLERCRSELRLEVATASPQSPTA